MPKSSPNRLYLIPVLAKALDVLEIWQRENRLLTLEYICRCTHSSKTTVYRILRTLVHRGYLAHSRDGLYLPIARPRKKVFGFCSQSTEMPFFESVSTSVRDAAQEVGVDLLMLDYQYNSAIAVRNADEFIQKNVDLLIEFKIEQHVAAIIGDKLSDARIPLITVDAPHPHAVYFGVDNYRVGFAAGQLLARHANQHWIGRFKRVLGLDLVEASALVQSRITGAFEAIHSDLPDVPIESFVRVDTRGVRDKSYRLVLDFLCRHAKQQHILIAAATDDSALGTVQAVRELKLEQSVAVVGQDCIDETIEEMARPDSPLIGFVSHEVHTYGQQLVDPGLAIVNGQSFAPYNYVHHRVVERRKCPL